MESQLLLRLALIGCLSAGLIASPLVAQTDMAQAASKDTKKKKKGRSDYTPEQREQIMKRAREICNKQFGASSRIYRIDYSKGQVWCQPPGN